LQIQRLSNLIDMAYKLTNGEFMKLFKNQSGNAAPIVLGLVVIVIIAAVAVKIVHDNKKSNSVSAASAPTSSTKAADLRATLVTLGIDHMTLTDQAVDAALDGNADATAFDTALNQNGTTIGAAVGSYYGSSAQKTFDTVWQIHLNDFVKYAVADKQGDSAAKTAALNDIQTNYTVPLAQYLAKANPNLPEATLQKALEMHVAMTALMIDDHVQGNYTAEANELNMANTDIAGLFSTLAQGIVTQFPSKF
jgi:hypothetical protein